MATPYSSRRPISRPINVWATSRCSIGPALARTSIRTRYPILLPLKHPRAAYRWRLVASIDESARAIIEGAVALVIMLTVCALRSHKLVLAGLAVVAIVVTAVRIRDRRKFMRARAKWGDAMRGDTRRLDAAPRRRRDRRRLVWGTQQGCVLLLTHDPPLQFASLMVQAGLIGIAIPMGVMHMLAMLRVSRSLGLLLMQNIDSEHCVDRVNTQLAEANARLTQLSLIDGLTGIGNRRAFAPGVPGTSAATGFRVGAYRPRRALLRWGACRSIPHGCGRDRGLR